MTQTPDTTPAPVIRRRYWCEATQSYVGAGQVWSEALGTWVGR